jgi:ABC-type transport system involved in multi-copper enzyme maturation permease subunit
MINKLRIWRALARGVLLESLRRKDLWVVAILGFLIICAAGALGFFGINGLEAFVKDLSVTVLGLFSTIMAVLTSCRLIPEEVKQRTLYPLLSRPISRFDLLFGKWLGAVVVTWIAFLILSLLTAGALVSFHVGFESIMLQYLLAKMMGLAVVCSVSLAMGTFMTPQAAATLSFILAFGSSMIVRGLLMAYDASNPAMAWIFKGINAILPQYSLFDLGGRVANKGWAPVPIWVLGFLFGYMAIYCLGMLGLSWSKFRRQAI